MSSGDRIVMVVDDDESVRTALARLFQAAGVKFRVFCSPHEFLAADQLNSAACLILDERMPGMRGSELQEICGKLHRSLPVIMMSAFGDDEAEALAMKMGALAYFHKPFDAGSLLKLVRQVLGLEDNT